MQLTFAFAEIGKLYKYRALIGYLTWARLKSADRDNTLGKLWSLLNPLASLGIYYFIFNVVFESRVEQFALFLFSAIIAWQFLVRSISISAQSITSNQDLISEAYFPKTVLPLSIVLSNAYDYLFGVIVLLLLAVFTGVPLMPMMLLWPLVFLGQLVFTLAASVLATTLGVFFRDLRNLLEIVFRLLFYFSGTMYSISRVPESIQPFFQLNPVYIFFESYRNLLLYNEFPPFFRLAAVCLVSGLMMLFALHYMGQKEGVFIKYL